MRVKALFHGGTNYADPDPETDIKKYNSIESVKWELENRFFDSYYPCIGFNESTFFSVWKNSQNPVTDIPHCYVSFTKNNTAKVDYL